MSDPATTNFGWVKPTVGADADTWGGVINADLDGIDAEVFAIASIVGVAGGELINLSTSTAGISTSLAGAAASLAGVSTVTGTVSASQAAISSSLALAAATGAGVSASVAGISASLSAVSASQGGVSASLTGISASLSATASSAAAASSLLGAVSSSLAAAVGALGAAVSGSGAGAIGYLGLPGNAQSGAYTLVPGDAGKTIYSTTSGAQRITVARNSTQPIAVDAAILVVNDGGGTITLAGASGVVLVWAGQGVAGDRALASTGIATLIQVAADRWYVTGPGLS